MHHPALIWFKRDLRTHDHAPLAAAHAMAPGTPLRAIYIIEPEFWAQEDAAAQHWAFIRECLTDLHAAMRAIGGQL